MANPYAANMTNQQESTGTGKPADADEYKNYKFNKVGDEIKGVITAQSHWLSGNGGTFRIINLENKGDKWSVIVGTDGQKQAVAEALNEAGLTDTAVGQLFKLTWSEARPTKNGRTFRVFTAKVAKTS